MEESQIPVVNGVPLCGHPEHQPKRLRELAVPSPDPQHSTVNHFTVMYRYPHWGPGEWHMLWPKTDFTSETNAAQAIKSDIEARSANRPKTLDSGVEYRVTLTSVMTRTLRIFTTVQ